MNNQNSEKTILSASHDQSKAFVAACIGMALFGITMVALGSVGPLLSQKLSLASGQIAILATILTSGIFIGSVIFGPICDHYGHKGIFLVSCVLVTLGLLGVSLADSWGALLIGCYLAIGVGGGVLNGQTNTLVSDLYDDENQRGGRLSLLGAFYGIGAMMITLLMYLTGNTSHFEWVLWGIIVVLALCTLFCFFVKFPQPKQPQGFSLLSALGLLKKPIILVMSLVLMLESTVETITNNLSTTYFDHIEGAVLLLTVMMIALTVARFVLNWLSGKLSQTAILYLFLCILLVGFVLVQIADGLLLAMVAMAFVGVGTAATYPVVLGLLGGQYPQQTGTVFGIAITIALAGATLLNWLVGTNLLHNYPIVMIACVGAMLLLFTIGNKLISSSK